VTEIHCTRRIGDSTVKFLRNGDGVTMRFEKALSWAVKYAAKNKIDNVFGVFELDRPIDHRYLNKIAPNGVIDRRDRRDGGNSTRATSAIRRARRVRVASVASSAYASSDLPILAAANSNSRQSGIQARP
jgi:hypothetical protein